ncbi:MAG: Hint domain-containing protein [Rubellimicrobium sp.]|nr:Hint domain-containing protein [Rubellimicrobium sp.]
MTVSSTIGSVYHYSGSLASLMLGKLVNFSLVNVAGGNHSATFLDDEGRLEQNDDGLTTVSIDGGPQQGIDYLGAGTVSTLSVLGIKLFPHPMMAFSVNGQIYLHFPNGLPPLSGLIVSFDVKESRPFDLPNPMPVCFAQGTAILTPGGEVAIERLLPGDMVMTRDHGPQPIRWIGRRAVGLAEQMVEPRLCAVLIRKDALGPGIPARDLRVTRQHRLLVADARGRGVLVAARLLVGRPGIDIAAPDRPLRYHHLLFDRHEIVTAQGCATESLYLGQQALLALPRADRDEIGLLFPGMGRDGPVQPARRFLTGREARALP